MRLKSEEIELRGFWIDLGSSMVPDSTWERINRLTAEYLQVVQRSEGADTLYRDPLDGRFWELIYLHPELKDGGPPLLRVIAPDVAIEKEAK
ncbi:MAG TPA: Imm27 family immunity protein [Desulfuromonadaceae bacterium]|jgi:hypothetical protein